MLALWSNLGGAPPGGTTESIIALNAEPSTWQFALIAVVASILHDKVPITNEKDKTYNSNNDCYKQLPQ